MAEKYKVDLDLPGNEKKTSESGEQQYLTVQQAGFIPRSVRIELTERGVLPDAPTKALVQACVLLADISGFTALGEKLTTEHGDSRGSEEFATQVSEAISALVNVVHKFEGEVVKIAGDCLICLFTALPEEVEAEDDEASFNRGKQCALSLLKVIVETNPLLDLHGGLSGAAAVQRIHLKELRGSSPRSNSARQRMKKIDDARLTMSKKEYERSKQRWFVIAGRPIKIASSLLDKAKAGVIKAYGGTTITRDTKLSDLIDEEEQTEEQAEIQRTQSVRRATIVDKYMVELATCPDLAYSYIPPIVQAKGDGIKFQNEQRRVVVLFLSLPSLAKEAVKMDGVNEANLNDVYSALKSVLAKFEGLMRDFLFEDKGCTLIACWGITQITEVDALRAVLFALEAKAACGSLGSPCKIGISMGQCFTGVCGHPSRSDFVVMGAETNMAARLMGKAPIGSALVSERVYNATKNYIGYDMSNPMEVKGKDGTFRALSPFGRKAGAVRHKSAEEWENAVFVGREKEMIALRTGLKRMTDEKKGGAYILEGLAGMGKSAIVWQLQRESIDQNIRYLMGTGSAIEKQTPYFAFSQIFCAAANLSSSPSYGEVLALKHTYELDEGDVNSLGIMLPSLAKRDEHGQQLEHGQLEARCAQVVLKIFQTMENTVFVFEDAHWIDSQSWIMLQMVLPQLSGNSMVMIVTRPPNMESQMKGGGQTGTEGFNDTNEEKLEDEWLEDDDRVKFSRILAALKENNSITYLELGVMGHAAMKELIAKTLEVPSTSVSDDVVKLMDQKAGGIPMYLSSMTNWLKERDMVSKDADGNVLFQGNIHDIRFPNSIMDTVMERIDSLDEQAKVLVKVCACFGFEFRLENLEKVAPSFLSSKDQEHFETTMAKLAARNLVVTVTGESVSKMMKFTHQIITESSYSLMLDSQKREVHLAIAKEYENSSVKYEMDVLAYHWLRSGEVQRGCDLLQNAGLRALDIGAFKECVNSLSQAIAYGKTSNKQAYWLSLLYFARFSYGDRMNYEIIYKAMESLNDSAFQPQKRSQGLIDKMMRRYGEYDDLPPDSSKKYDDIDKARLLIAFGMVEALRDGRNKEKVTEFLKRYNLSEDDIPTLYKWYHYYALNAAYEQSNYEIWFLEHNSWPVANEFELLRSHPDTVRRIFRRVVVLSECERLKPQHRANAISSAFGWYVVIAPEMVKDNLQRLQGGLELIEGNIKYANEQAKTMGALGWAHLSLANIKLCKHYFERMTQVKFDSEALEDQKATSYQTGQFGQLFITLIECDIEKFRNFSENLNNMKKMFPSAQNEYPNSFILWQSARGMACLSAIEQDWDTCLEEVKKCVHPVFPLIFPFYTHAEIFNAEVCIAIVDLFMEKQKGDDNDTINFLKGLLVDMRAKLDVFGQTLPGTHRCAGTAYAARITLALRDRPFQVQLKKLEEALVYTLELDCLPLDAMILECEIARWKGDISGMETAIEKLANVGYTVQVKHQSRVLESLKSGKLQAIDLSFIPEKRIEEVVEKSDQDKLAELEQEIMDAKAEIAAAGAAGDDEAIDAARAKAKSLRKAKKALKQEMEQKGDSNEVDQAKIDEIKAKIADATARQNQAFDDEDDDAEEAAAAEVKALTKELRALTGGVSIPKKKLEDAKKNAGFHMFVTKAKEALQGKNVGFTSILKMDFENVGVVVFDGTAGTMDVKTEDVEANATISMTLETFGKLRSKELDFMTGMGQQLIKVDGDMAVLMGMQAIMKKMQEESGEGES